MNTDEDRSSYAYDDLNHWTMRDVDRWVHYTSGKLPTPQLHSADCTYLRRTDPAHIHPIDAEIVDAVWRGRELYPDEPAPYGFCQRCCCDPIK